MRHLVNLGAVVASVALAMAVAAGTGYKLGWWGLSLGFDILEWSFFAGAAASAIGLLGLILSRQKGISLIILLAGGGVAIMICLQVMTARSVPRMHDITTDLENPPQFVEVLKLREKGENNLDYASKKVKDPETGEERPYPEVQRKAYPDVQPLLLDLDQGACFDVALETAKDAKWEMVNEDSGNGLIEATDTTFWFGFKDDVVIRLSEEDASCRVDMRSASRIGLSDVGVNAKRILTYMKALKAKAS